MKSTKTIAIALLTLTLNACDADRSAPECADWQLQPTGQSTQVGEADVVTFTCHDQPIYRARQGAMVCTFPMEHVTPYKTVVTVQGFSCSCLTEDSTGGPLPASWESVCEAALKGAGAL